VAAVVVVALAATGIWWFGLRKPGGPAQAQAKKTAVAKVVATPQVGAALDLKTVIGGGYSMYMLDNLVDGTHAVAQAQYDPSSLTAQTLGTDTDEVVGLDLATGKTAWTLPSSQLTGTQNAAAGLVMADGAGHEYVEAYPLKTDVGVVESDYQNPSIATVDPSSGKVLSKVTPGKGAVTDVEDGIVAIAVNGTITTYQTTDLTKALASGPYPQRDTATVPTGSYPSMLTIGKSVDVWTTGGYIDARSGKSAGFGKDGSLSVDYETGRGAAADSVYRCEETGGAGSDAATTTAPTFKATLWDTGSDSATWSAPVTVASCGPESNGSVDVFEASTKQLIGVDHKTGKTLWTRNFTSAIATSRDGNTPIVLAGTSLSALDMKTGKDSWSATVGVTPAAGSTGGLDLEAGDGIAYVAGGGGVEALNLDKKGAKLWQVDISAALPSAAFVSSKDGQLYVSGSPDSAAAQGSGPIDDSVVRLSAK
jgi:hypothetical protein